MGWLRRHKRLIPYLLLAPGLLWLAIFYVYPAFQMFLASLSTRTGETASSSPARSRTTRTGWPRYSDQFIRSIAYGLAATIVAFLIGYPLAYGIAFRAGRYKNLLLFLVIAPFFTSFLLRTLSWKIILADYGLLLGPLKDARHRARGLPPPGHAAGRRRRDHLQLPAVHDAAAVRRAREDRSPAGRGGPGPVRRAVAAGRHDRRRDRRRLGLVGLLMAIFDWSVPAGTVVRRRSSAPTVGTLFVSQSFLRVDLAAVAAGRVRRVAADVHPGRR